VAKILTKMCAYGEEILQSHQTPIRWRRYEQKVRSLRECHLEQEK